MDWELNVLKKFPHVNKLLFSYDYISNNFITEMNIRFFLTVSRRIVA